MSAIPAITTHGPAPIPFIHNTPPNVIRNNAHEPITGQCEGSGR